MVERTGPGAILGVVWQREQEGGELRRWLNYMIIRGSKVARLVVAHKSQRLSDQDV